jgi:hypothetical protein
MQTRSPLPPKAPVALLVLALVLAIVGIGGLLTGAADSPSKKPRAASAGRTTTTDVGADSNSPLVTVSVPPTAAGPTTTVKGTTATTKAPTATTQPPAPTCATTPATGNPGPAKPPGVGTYDYASCTSNDKVSIVVKAGNSGGGITRRDVQTQSQLGNFTAHDAFSNNGAVQEAATIVAFGFTLQCDWMPDITEYPANLSVGATWSADSECTLGNGAKIHATGTRKITGVASVPVGSATVVGWAIDETQKLVITAPNRSPSTFSSTSNSVYDASLGIVLYEKAVSEASGAENQPKTTTEIRLTSLTPKS